MNITRVSFSYESVRRRAAFENDKAGIELEAAVGEDEKPETVITSLRRLAKRHVMAALGESADIDASQPKEEKR